MKTKHINNLLRSVSTILIFILLIGLCGCTSAEFAPESTADSYFDSEPADGYIVTEEADNMLPEFNTEEYSAIIENSFVASATNPLSTFSADVDTAAYTNIRRMILDGYITPDAVRIEEMLNYFTYDYPDPAENEPFSVTTEISECPWNDQTQLLRIGLQAKRIDSDALPPSNLVFLIDVSGSMYSEDKLPLVQKAFGLLSDNLRECDRISIVTYASSDKVVLNGVHGNSKTEIIDAINALTAGGSTAGSEGILTAYNIAEENYIEGGINRIILATDGDLNVGVTSEGELKRLVEEKRKSGINLSVLGFGTGNIKDNKMETLADNGDGSYHYIDSALEARRVLVEEMGGSLLTIAKDVKLQIEFNPAYIKGYRLIGYENRVMANEDFTDDTKDAGDIGAGHRVTALYEIVPVDSEMSIGEVELNYSSPALSESTDWAMLKIRYKAPESDESTESRYIIDESHYNAAPSDDFRFAADVAQFGMLLRESKYSGTATYESVYDSLCSNNSVQGDQTREELKYLVSLMNQIN